MSFKLMVFCMIVVFNSFADSGEKSLNGYDPKVDIISENYEAGPFLIYDCVEKHWTCVMKNYYEDCEKNRAKDIQAKKREVSCAPIGDLENKKSCFQKQLFLVSQNYGSRFCISEGWKQKEIEY